MEWQPRGLVAPALSRSLDAAIARFLSLKALEPGVESDRRSYVNCGIRLLQRSRDAETDEVRPQVVELGPPQPGTRRSGAFAHQPP